MGAPVNDPPMLDDAVAVLDAFVDETRGCGGDVDTNVIHLETIRDHVVVAYPGAEGWWEARLEVVRRAEAKPPRGGCAMCGSSGAHEIECGVRYATTVLATFPLKQGPVWYADSDTTMADVVGWLREVCDAEADRD